ncbi:MBL fold metallo-hydrolase [Methanococcoides sp. NM1]|uniref:MBL fold metallo-hydrolase n=1 Tax=Methanococcoides sp. NM1 TaxID=1201013 RepID=UPI0010840B18|nr:MBL fold metallo-hydrolase [Methanococcoides sp. NM1]
MKITLLGTGDAPGTPIIGCDCRTCMDARNGGKSNRTRFSVLVESDEGRVLIDTSPDMRQQMLNKGIRHIDGVIWTHGHYDHYTGFGEFHRVQSHVDVYGVTETLDYILDYVSFLKPRRHDIRLCEPFELIGLTFTLFEVNHPPVKKAIGVMICEGEKKVVISGDTDNNIPESSLELIMEPDLFIVDAIIPDDVGFHVKKHMDAKEALEIAERIRAKDVVMTHLSHYFKPHEEASETYPLGYDGMEFTF